MTLPRDHKSGWLMFVATPCDWIVLGFVAAVCAGIWMSSAKLLVTSGWRDDGRVLSCIYFTGTDVIEWQFLNTPGGGEIACPLVKLG